jgi:protein SEY1
VAAYVTYTLNLWGPMIKMANAASQQAIEVGKERLREFLENSDTARHAVAMSSRGDSDGISLNTLDSRGKRRVPTAEEEDDDI